MVNTPPAGGHISPAVSRPNPLKEAASKVGTAWSAASGVIGALVTYGVLSGAQGEALTAVGAEAQNTVTAFGTVLGGILPLIAGVVTAFSATSAAKDHVTPVADPRNNAGQPLTPDTAPPRVPDKRVAGPTSSGSTVTDGDTWTS